MRPIGFSTGALAKGDFHQGIRLQAPYAEIAAIELSALRDSELGSLIAGIPQLDLTKFTYVSIHAPSKLVSLSEQTVIDQLWSLPRRWPIVVHPDILHKDDEWRKFGSRLCLENMDNRKPIGRTVSEMENLFLRFPEASFCLDVGHAKQIDPTMTTALLMLRKFDSRLQQVHVSDVGARGEHLRLGRMARMAFARLAEHIPAHCPLIIESVVVAPSEIEPELKAVRGVFESRILSRQLEHGWPACPLV